ncbi:uncharacterized protein METZ01_LOCUS113173 [marine metagenome]|uniref:Uncharacterized protein n=1 Tax=marine metagenome TaxID=408172 RepID=A0A381X6E3_9ZZZZ
MTLEHKNYSLLKLNDDDYALLCEEAMYFYEKTDDYYFENAGINKTNDEFLDEIGETRDNRFSIKYSVESDDDWEVIEEFLHGIREIRTNKFTAREYKLRGTDKPNTVEGMILGTFISEDRWDYWLAKHKEESK